MKLERLRELQARLATVSETLAAVLEESESLRDPLVVHIYQSRRRYDAACNRDQSKHQRSVERVIDTTFVEAQKLHFIGGRGAWTTILRSNEWTAKALQG